jgi:hypothetical protein
MASHTQELRGKIAQLTEIARVESQQNPVGTEPTQEAKDRTAQIATLKAELEAAEKAEAPGKAEAPKVGA